MSQRWKLSLTSLQDIMKIQQSSFLLPSGSMMKILLFAMIQYLYVTTNIRTVAANRIG